MTSVAGTRRGLGGRFMNRLLHTYFLAIRALTIGVRAVVRSGSGRVLLVRHSYTPGWHFPGGGVERGETIEWALGRELQQETGLVMIGRPVFHGAFFNQGVSRRDHVLVYLCEVESDDLHKSSSIEIAEVGFFDLDDLPDPMDPGTERRLREIAGGLERSAEW